MVSQAGGSIESKEIGNSAKARVLRLLQKNETTGQALDESALNLVTTPEYANLRANIVNHIKKQTVLQDAEGKAGRNPEEDLGTGKRSQIRFQPIIMKSKNTRINNSLMKRLMQQGVNRGVDTKPGQVALKKGRKGKSKRHEALTEGLNRAIKARYKNRMSSLFDKSKMNFSDEAMQSTAFQTGLREASYDNRTNKKRRKTRLKLDAVAL